MQRSTDTFAQSPESGDELVGIEADLTGSVAAKPQYEKSVGAVEQDALLEEYCPEVWVFDIGCERAAHREHSAEVLTQLTKIRPHDPPAAAEKPVSILFPESARTTHKVSILLREESTHDAVAIKAGGLSRKRLAVGEQVRSLLMPPQEQPDGTTAHGDDGSEDDERHRHEALPSAPAEAASERADRERDRMRE